MRESVARPSLIWEPVELAAEEGWAPVALEGEVGVLLLALEARREGTAFCQRWLLGGMGWRLTRGSGNGCDRDAAAGRLGCTEEFERHCRFLFLSGII